MRKSLKLCLAAATVVALGAPLVKADDLPPTAPVIPGAETSTPTPDTTSTTTTETTETTTSAPATGPEAVLLVSAGGGLLAMTLRRVSRKR